MVINKFDKKISCILINWSLEISLYTIRTVFEYVVRCTESKLRVKKEISFFQPLFDRELNGDSEYRVPVLQNPFLAEIWSKYWEGLKRPKKSCFQKLDSSFLSREFQALRQTFSDSVLKAASSHVTSRAVGQKMYFYENPKPRGLKLKNLFLQVYHRFQEKS